MSPALVYSLIAFGVLAMSTSSIIIRYSAAPAMVIALYRVVFTSLLAAFLGSCGMAKNCREMSRQNFLYMATAGLFLALHFAFWISSLSYTSISSSVLFTNLQVIFVLIFSVLFLGEKVNGWVVGGILVAISGSALIGYGDLASGRFLGDMLALASGLFVAIYFLIGRKVRAQVEVWTYTSMVSAAAALVLLPASALMGCELFSYPRIEWLFFFLLALGPGIAGHGILNWALKYVKAPVVAVSILGESVAASILAWILFQELLLWYQILGGIFILGGIYLAITNDREQGDGSAVHSEK